MTEDPVIPRIETRTCPIEVRRIGITGEDLHRLGSLRAGQRSAARAAVDSLLPTTLKRRRTSLGERPCDFGSRAIFHPCADARIVAILR